MAGARAGRQRWRAWCSIALGLAALAAAAHVRFTAGRFGFRGGLELGAGGGAVLSGIASLLPPARKRLRVGLRAIGAAALVCVGLIYLGTPRGKRTRGPCSGTSASCIDPALARECQDGVAAFVPCRGPKGCVETGALSVACDTGLPLEGDACMLSSEGQAGCSPDHRFALTCTDHRFTRTDECAGPRGCVLRASAAVCDQVDATPGASRDADR